MQLPQKHWGIFRNNKLITSGSSVGMTVEHLEEMAAALNGEIRYSNSTFGSKREVGTIFGKTWSQIQDMQQKL